MTYRMPKIGTAVDVELTSPNGQLIPGTFMGCVPCATGLTPAIRLDDNRVIHGYECWWHPRIEEVSGWPRFGMEL